MKVLWFSNTPANGVNYLNLKSNGGGWIQSLDLMIQEKLDLNIAFLYPKQNIPFQFENTHYFPIGNKNWRFEAIFRRLGIDINKRKNNARYYEIIEQVKPDIIHIHGTENDFLSIADKINIPIVVSYQGSSRIIYKRYSSSVDDKLLFINNLSFKKSLLENFFSIPFKVSQKRCEKNGAFEEEKLPLVKHIIGRTDWDRRITSILSPRSNYYHNDEILKNIFYSEEWKYRENAKTIIHTTNGNTPIKGFISLCEAAYELQNKNILNFEWRVAGISENDLIVKIAKKQLKNKYPQKSLRLLGNLDSDNLIKNLKEADCFVSTSHIENSSNALCEAMMLGLPCIATFAGGTNSLLKDGEDGILIQDNDPFAMAGAILELVNNKELAIKYGQSARIKALKRHNKDKIVNDLINIYKNIISITSK